jgi:Ca2+-binding RTX toxin-like protein
MRNRIVVLGWFADDANRVDYIQPGGGGGISAGLVEQRIAAFTGHNLQSRSPAAVEQRLEFRKNGNAGKEEKGLIPDANSFYQVVNGSNASEQVFGAHKNDILRGYAGKDQLFAGSGSDWLSGGEGDDYLDGGEGNDSMLGGPGSDQLGGDAGDDFMRGGAGNDTYIYHRGCGIDTIDNQDGGTDWIVFTGDLTEDRLRFVKAGDDLEIRIKDSPPERLIVVNWFLNDTYPAAYIRPADGSELSAETVTRLAIRE